MRSFRVVPLLTPIALLALLTACAVGRQIAELKNFARCDFRLNTVQNTTLAGVNVQNIRSLSDLNFLQAGQITAAYAQGNLPLDLVLNVDVKNPNAAVAALNRLEWILVIDDVEMTTGVVNDRTEIAPNGLTTLPIRIRADVRKALAGKSADATLNFGMNLVGAGNRPSRMTLKVKPALMFGTTSISYPGYLSVTNEFGGK